MKQRRLVTKECRDEEQARAQQRKQKMLQENAKRVAQEKKLREEKERLVQAHLITSSNELTEELQAVDKEALSAAKKKSKKVDILKTQVRIRKKVLGQNLSITFTSNRKQRPLNAIVKELCDHIDNNPLPEPCNTFIRNPTLLIGRRVKQRFLDGDGASTSTWYWGTVKEYSPQEKMHCLIYDGESEECHFDLTTDLLLGDLIIC